GSPMLSRSRCRWAARARPRRDTRRTTRRGHAAAPAPPHAGEGEQHRTAEEDRHRHFDRAAEGREHVRVAREAVVAVHRALVGIRTRVKAGPPELGLTQGGGGAAGKDGRVPRGAGGRRPTRGRRGSSPSRRRRKKRWPSRDRRSSTPCARAARLATASDHTWPLLRSKSPKPSQIVIQKSCPPAVDRARIGGAERTARA